MRYIVKHNNQEDIYYIERLCRHHPYTYTLTLEFAVDLIKQVYNNEFEKDQIPVLLQLILHTEKTLYFKNNIMKIREHRDKKGFSLSYADSCFQLSDIDEKISERKDYTGVLIISKFYEKKEDYHFTPSQKSNFWFSLSIEGLNKFIKYHFDKDFYSFYQENTDIRLSIFENIIDNVRQYYVYQYHIYKKRKLYDHPLK